MDDLKLKIKVYWKENSKKFNIDKHSGTWLHYVGYWIHRLAKLSAFIPDFSKQYKKKRFKLDSKLEIKLRKKLQLYQELIQSHKDQHGFIMHNHCDSLLYTGLFSVASNDMDIRAARDEDGYWYRRGIDCPCYPNGSKSTISRDMMLGLYWYLWEHRKLNLAESILGHAKRNNYVMGLGDPARLLMMPAGEATLAEICNQLGGNKRWFTRRQMQNWPLSLEGYEIHLLVQHVLLRGNILGQIPANAYKALGHYASQNPHNPLHTFAHASFSDGNMNETARLLLQENLWPAKQLPTSANRKNDWIISRDDGDNWQPSAKQPPDEHPGADFIVIAHQILRGL